MRFTSRTGSLRITAALTFTLLSAGAPLRAHAQVYFNNFQAPGSENTGLTSSSNISLTRFSLPTDGGGLSSANQSYWLGRLGLGAAKSPVAHETVNLSLAGLTAGHTYSVAFDVLFGGSWDGSAIGYGPDAWSLMAIGQNFSQTLVDATFSLCGTGNQLCGAYSPQTYSDLTPLGGRNGTTYFAPTTGADFANDVTYPDYSQDYAIYSFSHGAGNPFLTFVADASTATLVFDRGVSGGFNDSPDEYWALDNINVSDVNGSPVTAAPEPASLVLMASGLAGVVAVRRVRRKSQR